MVMFFTVSNPALGFTKHHGDSYLGSKAAGAARLATHLLQVLRLRMLANIPRIFPICHHEAVWNKHKFNKMILDSLKFCDDY
jgi:hypothetical protein